MTVTIGLVAAAGSSDAVIAHQLPKPGQPVNPAVESTNYSRTLERQKVYDTPAYQAMLTEVSAQNAAAAAAIEKADPQREFSSDVCWNGGNGCAGDVRLYNWQTRHYGIVDPVLFTARDGAQLAGHVWATRSGPQHRPGIVITDGSVQADEQMYWYAAQALAKSGFVVLTWDPQGQGQSDTYGQGKDRGEGFPAQSDGRPFFDGTEDAINFFESTPQHAYVPVASCNSGTSHATYQQARAKAGDDSAYNPFWQLLNRKEIGLAGHSYGAAGVSYIGQSDKRVKAIVAWDNLSANYPPSAGSFPPGEKGCVDKHDRAPGNDNRPALGMSADYFLPPEPNVTEPAPNGCNLNGGAENQVNNNFGCKDYVSRIYSKRHIDTGEVVIRGGSHLDFSFIPNNGFPATRYGADMITWYTIAWFDKYLKHSQRANRMLRTTRWRHDPQTKAIDPGHIGNMFSFYYPSRMDIHLGHGKRFHCEHLVNGCADMTSHDGHAGAFSYLHLDTRRDGRVTAKHVPRGEGLYPKSGRLG